MRLRLPTTIPLAGTLGLMVPLCGLMLLERTTLTFTLLFFAFVVMGNIAFNEGGGFSRASGGYVFVFCVLTCAIGVAWKALLGEAADSNLLVPQLDMASYTAAMFMLLLVILLNRVITGRAEGIGNGVLDYTMASTGCLAIGLLQTLLNIVGSDRPGSVVAAVNQLSRFYDLAIILGTIGAIRDSGGRRSVSLSSGLAMTIAFTQGALAFSKEGMITPMACWFVGAAFMQLRLKVINYILLASFAVATFTVIPLVAEGRTLIGVGGSYPERAAIDWYIVTHLSDAKEFEQQTLNSQFDAIGRTGYYNSPQGFIERLSVISPDDTFFNYTNQGHYVGYGPVIENYENLVPHIILPDKPVPISGNYYAHEIGGFLAENDFSTGISFSSVAEAYHIGGWAGIFLLLPAVWLTLFISVDYICGDLRRAPWGLLAVVIFAHAGVENLLGSLIWLSGFGNLGLLLGILFCTRFAPIIGALFSGSDRTAQTPGSGAIARSSA